MKKIILSLMLATVLLLTVGCSCSEPSVLVFNKLWTTQEDNYTEILDYDVSYKSDYAEHGYNFTKSKELGSLTPTISGTYTVTTTIMSIYAVPEEVKAAGSYSIANRIIKIHSLLSLNTTYVYGSHSENDLSEHIETTAYVSDIDTSLTPIYVERDFEYFVPSVKDSLTLTKQKGKDVTVYNGGSYTVKKEYGESYGKKSSASYDYTAKTLIDNSSLLFAIRNKKLSKDSSTVIPVVHPSYGAAQELSVKNFYINIKQTYNIKYFSDTAEDVEFTAKGFSFVLNSVNGSGTSQVCYIQQEVVADKNNSLLLKYVEPIVEYNGYRRVGALVYTLNSVQNP